VDPKLPSPGAALGWRQCARYLVVAVDMVFVRIAFALACH
jgi:hypothetical protein